MRKSDLIFMSMGNLWRRKLRTILTLLGVVIGTASIIIMISLGVGMKVSINAQLKEWGSLNVIEVMPQYDFQRGKENKRKATLNDETIEQMSAIEGATVVSPVKSRSVMLRHGKYYAYANITAVKKDLLVKQNIKLSDGTFFDENTRNDFLFGGRVAYNFRDPRSTSEYFDDYYIYGMPQESETEKPKPKVDVMNDQILLNPDTAYGQPGLPYDVKKKIPKPIRITVSGVIQEGNFQFDRSIYTSLETFDKIEKDYEKWRKKVYPDQQQQQENGKKDKRKKEYNQVQIFVEDMEKVEAVEAAVKKMGFQTYSMIGMLKEANGFADIAQMVLGGIGAVSLFVAAIGISNTMVMSIYERTKEIGVMKVIGASLQDIQGMFLTEAALIGLIGGIMGLILSTGGSMLLNFLTQGAGIFGTSMNGESPPISIIPLWLYLLGMIFTTAVGLISGYLPARRAMKLSVLKALRNE
ncbi:ABC transporter permease [Clostridiales bacterium COT073_COT-073]|nr:ABC transporter permease [Clostridiales bacterium COT073_COT-073]